MDSEISVQAPPKPIRRKRERGHHGLGNLYQHRANWWLDVKRDCRRYRIKIGPVKLLEKQEARIIADEEIKKMLLPKADAVPVIGAMSFSEFAKKYATWAPEVKLGWEPYRGRSANKTPVKHAVAFFGETSLKDIRAEDIEDFRAQVARRRVAGRPVKNRTVNAEIRLLRHMFNQAIRWGDAVASPVAKFKYADENRQKAASRVFENDEEQNKFLSALPGWLRLIARFALQTGARRGDILKLTWKSVHPEYVEFLETKEGTHRPVPLSCEARNILAMLRPSDSPDPNAYVFEPGVRRPTLIPKIRHAWAHAHEKSGIQKIRFHDMRHTVGTRLVQSGVDLPTVQSILGHRSLKTTQRYLHGNDKLKLAAVEKLGLFANSPPQVEETSVAEFVTERIN